MFFSHRFFSSILLGLNGHNNQATCYKMICFQENALGTSHAAINLLQSFMVPWFPLVLWFALNDQDHQVLMGLYGNIFPGPLILVTYLKRRPQKGIKYIKLWRNMTNIEKAWKSPNTFPMKFPVPHGRGITEGEVGHGGAWDVTCTNTLRRDTHPTHCVVVCPNSCFENPFFLIHLLRFILGLNWADSFSAKKGGLLQNDLLRGRCPWDLQIKPQRALQHSLMV